MLVLALATSGLAQKKSARVSGQTVLPAGTAVEVRVDDYLSSEESEAGQTFTGTLMNPVVVNGQTVYPKGAIVNGRVLEVEKSGRLSDPGMLKLELTSVTSAGRTSQLYMRPLVIEGESHKKSNVAKIGGGAAAGAIIGAIAGGGKGAAIGAGVGAAAGTGVAAATGKKPAEVESEAIVTFVAGEPPASATLQQRQTQSSSEPRDYDQQHRMQRETKTRSYDEEDANIQFSDEEVAQAARGFSARDRRSIRQCIAGNPEGLPPGLAKRETLPPGLERQLRRNGTLPPGLQKKVAPLPLACEQRLPRLPNDIERVIYGGRVMLVNSAQRILDLFLLEE